MTRSSTDVATASVHLALLPLACVLTLPEGGRITLAVSCDEIVARVLRHDPPMPSELEQAIELVEQALDGLRLEACAPQTLACGDPRLLALPGLDQVGAILDRDAIEGLFQRLALRVHGSPIGPVELPEGRSVAAALLVLRELMHHLGFDQVVAIG